MALPSLLVIGEIGGTTFQLPSSATTVSVDTTLGSVNLILPEIEEFSTYLLRSAGYSLYPPQFVVYDVKGNAGTNPITIAPFVGDSLNSSNLVKIDTNFGSTVINLSGFKTWLSFGSGSGSSAEPVTWNDLNTLATSGSLIKGDFYLITDFRTRYIIPNTAVVDVGATEPIIVQASSSSTIYANAISTIHNKDIIYYELVDTTTSGGDRGRIYYRKDSIINVSTTYNWRVVKFRRWDDGSGNFVVIAPNSNPFADFYTFNNSPSASNTADTEISAITDFGVNFLGAPSSRLNNIVLKSATIVDNTFDNDCFNNTLSYDDAMVSNKIEAAFAFNTMFGSKLCINNTIDVLCVGNTIGGDFSGNNIAFSFQDNVALDNFQFNTIGGGFSNNTIGNIFSSNRIGEGFATNVIADHFENNSISENFTFNSIGNGFVGNQIGNAFQQNVIQDDFVSNVIGNSFIQNINIHNNFQLCHIETSLQGVDFDLATFVYQAYTKNIFRNSALVFRLSYTDGADTIIYSAPNA